MFEFKELTGNNLEVRGTKFFKLRLLSEDGKLGLNKEHWTFHELNLIKLRPTQTI